MFFKYQNSTNLKFGCFFPGQFGNMFCGITEIRITAFEDLKCFAVKV